MKHKLFLLGFLLCSTIAVTAAELKVDQIIEKANLASFYAGENGRSDARMIIVDAKGNKQLRQFVIYRQDVVEDGKDNGDQNFLVVFSRPADVRGTVFLVHKKAGSDDDRWLYLPALDLEKRISASDNRTSFVGANFFYEDVSGRHPAADEHQLVSETDQYYVIKSTPKAPAEVEFVSYELNIDKQTFLPMKIAYSNQAGEVYRQVEVVEVAIVQGHPTVMKSKVSDLRSNGYTLLEFRRPSYDVEMADGMFTTRSLRNPPK
ncbi:outer membrane lipoprotein-sorting protein [Marinicella sp. S1101]|uniref:outer membrane lipoprotein-sorting protein n=1 Tax=Marinicella marina TaxID=2996016 RepID=UPI002260C46C|nr:outer membrane lipoprotein-sorting protein [Marinicella marina]MCX7554752.1 outer membrane lipoprotein-sorting protein [Marinicella marina]MDJ1141432.1 outer membrane lipoprotein-sorting protein [Marinicella marina]